MHTIRVGKSLIPVIVLALAYLVALTACQPIPRDGEKPLRILCIGNSYTFYNDLPATLARLMRTDECEPVVEMVAHPGWTLADHAQSEETMDTITEGSWDYVLLQEQSVLPALAQRRENEMYPAVRALNDTIRQVGAQTVLIMTWGRRDGLPSEGFPDYASMQSALSSAGATEIAEELDALVAPVGIGWQRALAQEPEIGLWDADGSHPSESGSYLAAAVLYATILGSSPEAISYDGELPTERALFLRQIAAKVVLD
jgi:hypothetical protein